MLVDITGKGAPEGIELEVLSCSALFGNEIGLAIGEEYEKLEDVVVYVDLKGWYEEPYDKFVIYTYIDKNTDRKGRRALKRANKKFWDVHHDRLFKS